MTAVMVRGQELHHDEIDPADGSGGDRPVIVWGHGLLLAAELYHPLIAELPGYRHVAVDFRGHGRSAAVTDDATLARIAQDVWDVVSGLGIDRFFYVGHSTGNAVGVRLAAQHPDAVVAAVGLAGAPLAGTPDSCRPLYDAFAGLIGDRDGLRAALGGTLINPGQDALLDQIATCAATVESGPALSYTGSELFLDESAQILPALGQPWMFLVPSEDGNIPPEAQMEMARSVPGARAIWLNGEGHLFPQEKPAETAAWIDTFFTTVTTG